MSKSRMFIYLKRLFFKILRKTPSKMEMVKYWKIGEDVHAKVTELNGSTVMYMEGEKYAFQGFPRGYLLFGTLSKLKHEVKNQIFNDSWAKLENKESDDDVVKYIRETLPNIYKLLEKSKYDMFPPQKMVISVREIHRAWTKVSPNTPELRDLITYILQEDDSYRMRLQWIVGFMPTWLFKLINPVKPFLKALKWLEDGEIIGDMKERQRLFKRIIETVLKEERFRETFTSLFREIDWGKVKLTKADKYFFRGKYFKVDLDKFDY